MNPAVVVKVGSWFIVWTSSVPVSPGRGVYWCTLGSFQDEALANSLRDAFNDPANHVDNTSAPGVASHR